MKRFVLNIVFVLFAINSYAQTWPIEWKVDLGTHTLSVGQAVTGFYDPNVIRQIHFNFPSSSYWSDLTANYATKTNLLCHVNIDGVAYDSCGVRFRGQTSYMGGPGGPGGGSAIGNKKSFNINLDWLRSGQDVMSYNSLNLLNGFLDPSFLREVVYFQMARKHIPTAKANFSHLHINGSDWGLYPSVQQLDRDFYKEWFLTNDGASWRADVPPGSPGGFGGAWGDGTAAYNYLGADSSSYMNYYTLKFSDLADPWHRLVEAITVLDTVSNATMWNKLNDYFDIDRALWYMATEIAFCDDDGYIHKGKMDYYTYEEAETSRMTPIQYDGNSSFDMAFATSWSPFYNATNVNYPLMNRLMAVPAIRQRYLAHMRSIMRDEFNSAVIDPIIDNYKNFVDSIVVADPVKIYTYANFNSECTALKNFIVTRRNYINANPEIAAVAPTINAVSFESQTGTWAAPAPFEVCNVKATLNHASGINKATLFYSNGIVGKYLSTMMYDDGNHNDSAAGDGVFGGTIPGFDGASWVRFYIEAAANDAAKTVSYAPDGAEHNVFVYQVTGSPSSIIENNEFNILLTYPNPSNDFINIKGITFENLNSLQIFDAKGSIMPLVIDNNQNIDIRLLAKGMYFIKATDNNNKQFIGNFIKQ